MAAPLPLIPRDHPVDAAAAEPATPEPEPEVAR
jgi:hypothetical protein